MQNNLYIRYGKRIFDVCASFVGMIILSPLFITIAVLIKLTDRGPVFFSQSRAGLHFKFFPLLKFRSMVVNADKMGSLVTAGSDPRVTRIGKFLRKTKLDELPQLINVLKGDISIVGPRPETPRFVEIFKDDYQEILSLKPGMTDYATIEFRNEEDILKGYDDPEDAYIKKILPQKIKLYKRYLKDISFTTDVKLIFHTLWKIVT